MTGLDRPGGALAQALRTVRPYRERARPSDPAAKAAPPEPLRRAGAGVARTARYLSAAVLVVLTVVGTLALTALPFGWIVLVAHVSAAVSLPPFVPLIAVLGGIPALMIGGVKLLLVVNDAYERLRGQQRTGRVAPVWRRSLTDTKRPTQRRMLDVVLVVAVCAAVAALFVWFVMFSGKSIQL